MVSYYMSEKMQILLIIMEDNSTYFPSNLFYCLFVLVSFLVFCIVLTEVDQFQHTVNGSALLPCRYAPGDRLRK